MIEQGRRKNPKLPKELIICPPCQAEVENEIRFSLYAIRTLTGMTFFKWICTYQIPNFKNLTHQDKYI